MFIAKRVVKEEIGILHQNSIEMLSNISKLKEEGWSDNTRTSLMGLPVVRLPLGVTKEDFQFNHPGVTVHFQQPGALFPKGESYVFYTEHEREIESYHPIVGPECPLSGEEPTDE
jgi:hypothetical protein